MGFMSRRVGLEFSTGIQSSEEKDLRHLALTIEGRLVLKVVS